MLSAEEWKTFMDALTDHEQILRSSFHQIKPKGDCEICTICGSKIYGVVCCNDFHECVHWGCAFHITGYVGLSTGNQVVLAFFILKTINSESFDIFDLVVG